MVGPSLFSCCLQYVKLFISVHAARGVKEILDQVTWSNATKKMVNDLCGQQRSLNLSFLSLWLSQPPLQIARLQCREAAISVLRLRRGSVRQGYWADRGRRFAELQNFTESFWKPGDERSSAILSNTDISFGLGSSQDLSLNSFQF